MTFDNSINCQPYDFNFVLINGCGKLSLLFLWNHAPLERRVHHHADSIEGN